VVRASHTTHDRDASDRSVRCAGYGCAEDVGDRTRGRSRDRARAGGHARELGGRPRDRRRAGRGRRAAARPDDRRRDYRAGLDPGRVGRRRTVAGRRDRLSAHRDRGGRAAARDLLRRPAAGPAARGHRAPRRRAARERLAGHHDLRLGRRVRGPVDGVPLRQLHRAAPGRGAGRLRALHAGVPGRGARRRAVPSRDHPGRVRDVGGPVDRHAPRGAPARDRRGHGRAAGRDRRARRGVPRGQLGALR
jgi:hypothetical protein